VRAERRKSWNCEFLKIFAVVVLIYSLVIYAIPDKIKAKFIRYVKKSGINGILLG
jgi:hypothetical protein